MLAVICQSFTIHDTYLSLYTGKSGSSPASGNARSSVWSIHLAGDAELWLELDSYPVGRTHVGVALTGERRTKRRTVFYGLPTGQTRRALREGRRVKTDLVKSYNTRPMNIDMGHSHSSNVYRSSITRVFRCEHLLVTVLVYCTLLLSIYGVLYEQQRCD